MRKLTITSIFLFLLLFANAQKVQIVKVVDKMEDQPYFILSRDMVVSNQNKTSGARLSAFIEEKDSTLIVSGISIQMVNIGSNCVEDNELVILFDDDSKITLHSWNKFNCDGNAWFMISDEESVSLSKLKIKKIKVTNGRTYDSFTSLPSVKDKTFYIETFKAAKDKNVKVINK